MVLKARKEKQTIALQQAKAQKHLLEQGAAQSDSVKAKLRVTEKELDRLRHELADKERERQAATEAEVVTMAHIKSELDKEREERQMALKKLEDVQKSMRRPTRDKNGRRRSSRVWSKRPCMPPTLPAQKRSQMLAQLKKQNEALAAATRANLRRKYYNEVEDLKGKIGVTPRAAHEQDRGRRKARRRVRRQQGPSPLPGSGEKKLSLTCLGPKATQEEVFADTKKLVQSVFDGYNVCIFAYGQTGSGKTFTLSGPIEESTNWGNGQKLPDAVGVQPRAIHELFRIVKRDSDRFSFSLKASMMELYRNDIIDLLNPSASKDLSTGEEEGKKEDKAPKIKKDGGHRHGRRHDDGLCQQCAGACQPSPAGPDAVGPPRS